MTDRDHIRRIDRVASPEYLGDLTARSSEELREMREECRAEEARLSYLRRLLHGQIDIVRAEAANRASEQSRSVMETLGDILAESAPTTQRSAVNADVYVPDSAHNRPRDRVLDDIPIAQLPDLDDEQLSEISTTIAQRESDISSVRRVVITHLDRLQAEMIARYRDGEASVDDIFPSEAK